MQLTTRDRVNNDGLHWARPVKTTTPFIIKVGRWLKPPSLQRMSRSLSKSRPKKNSTIIEQSACCVNSTEYLFRLLLFFFLFLSFSVLRFRLTTGNLVATRTLGLPYIGIKTTALCNVTTRERAKKPRACVWKFDTRIGYVDPHFTSGDSAQASGFFVYFTSIINSSDDILLLIFPYEEAIAPILCGIG